uniref:MYCBP-associated protein-like isoform X1 n=1 Tax=Ciona intestinalis TaxID=7719 RepID=UPI000180C89B|nr:MYCBP-associated protein-like isoform X1 [Ciona intestinalis]|eukprot:XP_026693353.1 MYCBP-associated protein-like isoform X1 [Ciona intestinalis]
MVGLSVTSKEGGNRPSVKASSRNFSRPKSPMNLTAVLDRSKKKVSGTPDKPGSPAFDHNKPVVINNEEIQRLAIRDEDLSKLRKSLEVGTITKEPEKTAYLVRKPRPGQEKSEKPKKQIVVARPAPPNAKLKPIDYSGPAGPRYNTDGSIIPHSILGTVRDFVDVAIQREVMRPDSPAATKLPEFQHVVELDVEKYQRPPTAYRAQIPTAINQEKALYNWRKKMAERKKQQGYISRLLHKPSDRLVMNQDDAYRSMQEKRKLVDRSIPALDYGKGYRVGSEFWKQHESFGDDLTGIKMSITKTERGSPVEFEHIGKPVTVRHETGATRAGEEASVDPRRTWHSSRYLKQRTRQLEPIMKDLDPYNPDLLHLEVIGNDDKQTFHNEEFNFEVEYVGDDKYDSQQPADPLYKYPDVNSEPIFGPSIIFDGVQAQWVGSSFENKGKVGAVARVGFESSAGERTSSHLMVENNGTTAVYYEWRKVPKEIAFEALKPDLLQRFYFNTGEGVILPGDTTKFPFVFKSPNAGIFTETWELMTKPAVLGGASLQVVLKGVAVQDDNMEEERKKIEEELESREAGVIVKKIIEDIIRGIQTPERSPSPIDAYITEEEIFMRKNNGRYYDHETIMELKNIYLQLYAEEDREGKEWNLSLDELQTFVSALPDEGAKEELLSGLNAVIGQLSFPPLTPTQKGMYAAGYKLWQDAIDNIVSCSMMVRGIMGLPEVIMTEVIGEPEPTLSATSRQSSAEKSLLEKHKPDKDDKKKGKKSTGKDSKDDGKGKKGKKDAKDKDRPKSKDPKAKGGKAPSPTKEIQERDTASKTPSSVKTIPTDSLDPVTRRKLTEKMYSQVYELLLGMVDNMTLAFEEVKSASE